MVLTRLSAQMLNKTNTLPEVSADGFDLVIDATGVPSVIAKSFDYLESWRTVLAVRRCTDGSKDRD
jgi:threonine dehydrogenase-like Zn-dependent dehydrogenase